MRINVLIFLFSGLFSMMSAGQSNVKVYDTFSEFEALLDRNDGKTYVINFWATWCKPCVAELPHFEALNAKYADKNVEVILVSLDFKKHLDTKLYPFITKNKIGSKVVVLADSKQQVWIDKVDPSWSGTIPATLIYNSKNRLFAEQEFETYDELESLLKEIQRN